MSKNILIVDDAEELALIVKDFLEVEGFTAFVAFNGKEAMAILECEAIDLAVLDIMLPDDDGMDICRRIRSVSDMPIIMLSAKSDDMDKILSLGLGADEYLTKPYSPPVVVAHIKALFRRYKQHTKSQSSGLTISHKDFFMDHSKHIVRIGEVSIDLIGKEFELLWYLASHPEEVFTKEQIYDQVWGEEEFGEYSTVTVHVRKIRSKFEKAGLKQYIKTLWGVGYKFEQE